MPTPAQRAHAAASASQENVTSNETTVRDRILAAAQIALWICYAIAGITASLLAQLVPSRWLVEAPEQSPARKAQRSVIRQSTPPLSSNAKPFPSRPIPVRSDSDKPLSLTFSSSDDDMFENSTTSSLRGMYEVEDPYFPLMSEAGSITASHLLPTFPSQQRSSLEVCREKLRLPKLNMTHHSAKRVSFSKSRSSSPIDSQQQPPSPSSVSTVEVSSMSSTRLARRWSLKLSPSKSPEGSAEVQEPKEKVNRRKRYSLDARTSELTGLTSIHPSSPTSQSAKPAFARMLTLSSFKKGSKGERSNDRPPTRRSVSEAGGKSAMRYVYGAMDRHETMAFVRREQEGVFQP